MSDSAKEISTNALMDSAVDGLRRYIDHVHQGNVSAAKRAFGMTGNTLDAWLNGTRRPTFAKLGPILEKMQAYIVFPGETESGEFQNPDFEEKIIALTQKNENLERLSEKNEKIIALQDARINDMERAKNTIFSRVRELVWAAREDGRSLAAEIGIEDHELESILEKEKIELLAPLLSKMLARIPEVDRIWLYLGVGRMRLANNPKDQNMKKTLEKLSHSRQDVIDVEHQIQNPDGPNSNTPPRQTA